MARLHDDLGARLAARDPDALAEAYDRYSAPMFAVAVHLLGDRERAADAVQQAFLQAWRAAERFDPEADLRPWLYQIVRRTAIDVHRRNGHGRDRRPDATLDDVPPAALAIEDPGVDRAWLVWEVREAVDALPADEAVVVRLTHLDGLTMPEVAERLGIPVGTVKSRSHRAHRRLAAALRHLRGGDDHRAGDEPSVSALRTGGHDG